MRWHAATDPAFRRALGLSLALHAIVLTLVRPEWHRHDFPHMRPLVVELRPPAPRPVAPGAPEVPAQPPRPVPEQRAPKPRQRVVQGAAPPVLAPRPQATPQRAEPPAAAPAVPASPGPAVPPAAAAVKEAPRVTEPGFAASYLANPKPPYPMSARRNGETGKVVLKVLVTREGLAGRVELESSSGFDALDRSALETVKRWRFTPATQGDEPVEAWVRVPIEFRLGDR
ncbi:MAG: energy transducer TonB [Pseudomonadota bacterium]